MPEAFSFSTSLRLRRRYAWITTPTEPVAGEQFVDHFQGAVGVLARFHVDAYEGIELAGASGELIHVGQALLGG